MEDSSLIAAIDIGSNSIHLAIGRASKFRGIDIIDSEKVTTQLGRSLDESGRLSPEAIKKTSETIASLARISESYTKRIKLVATHATREARNTDELIAAIKSKSGLTVEVIDGIEEARLCFLGIRHGLPIGQTRCLAVDVGGGSTEIILARGEKIEFVTSLKIGAVTLTKQFLQREKYSDSDIARLRDHIKGQISSLAAIAKDANFSSAILSSGTAKTLANIDVYLHHGEELDDINGHRFEVSSLSNIVGRLLSLKEPRKIRTRLNISQSRSEIITAGTLIIEEVTKLFSVKQWQYSSFSLREGIIVDALQKTNTDSILPADQVRGGALLAAADQFHVDKQFSSQVFNLAKQAYEFLDGPLLGKLNPHEKSTNLELLEACCLLHEAGKFLTASNYHQHSAYLIANASIAGFTQAEKYLVAYAILTHRKGGAKPEQLGWARLYYENIRLINILSACLRIGSCLNRTRSNNVQKLKMSANSRGFEISIQQFTGDISAEKQKLESELKFLSRKLDVELGLG